MPRPIRIEYEDAYYHVMNRGRRHANIYESEEDYRSFLSTLEEAHSRFGVEILSYCLMSNHYHLLVKTPEANLGRVMRHINGVYTQRYNRRNKMDGPLFRGRYKAIVIEENSYQLQVSRYIHLNPLEAKMIEQLTDYQWSSFKYYVSKAKAPDWLYPKELLEQIGKGKRAKERYRTFVELGVDEELKQYYGKTNLVPYLGSDEFRSWAYNQKQTEDHAVSEIEKAQFRPSMDKIIKDVSIMMETQVETIINSERGKRNIPRWVAMYLCQEAGGHRLISIAKKFGLKRAESISTTIAKLKVILKNESKLKKKLSQY